MNRCATCKHWDDLFQQHPNQQEGGCALTLADGESGQFMGPVHDTRAHAFIIFPDDHDQFQRAILITQADFGCTQWESA